MIFGNIIKLFLLILLTRNFFTRVIKKICIIAVDCHFYSILLLKDTLQNLQGDYLSDYRQANSDFEA